MNIEDIVPELFEGKKAYYCQRCLNHGLYEPRKGHKPLCQFISCSCSLCIMVDKRRQLSKRLVEMESSECTPERLPRASSSGEESSCRLPKERRPNCQRCAQHGVANRLKGHKRDCPFKECYCAKCQVVVERQKLMADQIKLRRRQKREKNRMAEKLSEPTQQSPEPEYGERPAKYAKIEHDMPRLLLQYATFSFVVKSFAESAVTICNSCTQQALTYQHLMSYLDPASAADPLFTLAAILQVCPHRP